MLKNKDKGFTIIEVVLVLAIAGLIFLVVFLALPALQRSQRDTARRQDVGNVISALQSYMSDNKNNMPTSPASFSNYYGTLAQATTVSIAAASTQATAVSTTKAAATTSMITIQPGMDCDAVVGARSAAVSIKLESSNTFYCQAV